MRRFLVKFEDSRINWKSIVVIVVFAFLAGGINFYNFYQFEKELSYLYSSFFWNQNKNKKKPQLSTEFTKSLSPKEVVERFIEADMAGARLGGKIGKGAPSIEDYLGPNFYSLYDTAMVIKGYEILEDYPSEDGKYYFVKVKYYCAKGTGSGSMGINEETELGGFYIVPCSLYFKFICPLCFKNSSPISHIRQFNLQEGTETITFTLIKDGDKWKIDSPSIEPHISQKTFEKELLEGR
jgi:hypothetical protein